MIPKGNKDTKIFIDVGSHIGQSIHAFYKEIKNAADWRMYCFEPIQYDNLINSTKGYNNVECIRAAAGIRDGKIAMFQVPAGGQGTTVIRGKLTGDVDYRKEILVNCIDFIKWFKDNIEEGVFVIIKMNIEGGEYTLMPRLLEVMPQIAGLWIKLHHPKFELTQKAKMIQIYKDFKMELLKYNTFVFCDVTESSYRFKWLVDKTYEQWK